MFGTKSLNTELVNKNYNQLKELANVYEKMGEAVERHRLEIISLIDMVQTFGAVDESILKRLDDSVELLLKTLDALARTPKDQESGLGGTLVPRTLLFSGIKQSKNPKQFGGSTFIKNNTVLAGYRLPFTNGISVTITFKPPTITFQYNGSNINPEGSIVSFILTNSTNIVDPVSGVGVTLPFIFPDTFKTKMLEELVKLAAIIDIFNFERERINDFACNYKEFACDLKTVHSCC